MRVIIDDDHDKLVNIVINHKYKYFYKGNWNLIIGKFSNLIREYKVLSKIKIF